MKSMLLTSMSEEFSEAITKTTFGEMGCYNT